MRHKSLDAILTSRLKYWFSSLKTMENKPFTTYITSNGLWTSTLRSLSSSSFRLEVQALILDTCVCGLIECKPVFILLVNRGFPLAQLSWSDTTCVSPTVPPPTKTGYSVKGCNYVNGELPHWRKGCMLVNTKVCPSLSLSHPNPNSKL